jgi:hypothetical protein
MSTRTRLLLVLTLGGAIAPLLPASALAKQRYPQIIQSYFCGGNGPDACPGRGTAPNAPICQTQPPCRICHIQGTTGSGTIQTPFGVSMLARGLSGDNGSVCTALSALDADKVDSDGDGTPDTVELENLDDPNTAANVKLVDEPTPTYGCGVASGTGGRWLLATVSTLVALFVLRRARRRG